MDATHVVEFQMTLQGRAHPKACTFYINAIDDEYTFHCLVPRRKGHENIWTVWSEVPRRKGHEKIL
jgi:hypothetical protein